MGSSDTKRTCRRQCPVQLLLSNCLRDLLAIYITFRCRQALGGSCDLVTRQFHSCNRTFASHCSKR